MSVTQIPYATAENWCLTSSRVRKLNFTWTIENPKFSLKYSKNTKSSSTFPIGNTESGPQWFLKLSEEGSYVNVSFNLANSYLTAAKFQVYILNAKQEKCNTKQTEISSFTYAGKSVEINFIDSKILFNNANQYLLNDKLTLVCEVWDYKSFSNISGGIALDRDNINNNYSLTKELTNLFQKGEFSDIILQAKDKQFKAHKLILAAGSTVFAAMFRHQLEEQKSNCITIDDIEPDVLGEMLDFIYSGQASQLTQMARELLAVAEKYDLKILKHQCEHEISKTLSIDTAVEILLLADHYRAEVLRAQTIEFIKGHAKTILKSPEWKLIKSKHSSLSEEITEQFLNEFF